MMGLVRSNTIYGDRYSEIVRMTWLDNKLNEYKKMKTLTYKGFGFDSEFSLIFKISVEKSSDNKVRLGIFSDDLTSDLLPAYNYDISDGHDKAEGLTVDTFSKYFNKFFIDNHFWPYGFSGVKEYRHPSDWDEMFYGFFPTVEEAVSKIKEIVSLYREYWKAQKGEYNELSVQLKNLRVEKFLPENYEVEVTETKTFTQKVKLNK